MSDGVNDDVSNDKGNYVSGANASIADRFEHYRQRYLPHIMELIDETVRATTPDDSQLRCLCAYHLKTGGKRLRALLPLLVADTMGVDPTMMVPFGAACEMLHNATLVHDDLQDGDRQRRGRDAVWARYGTARAINVGDAMFYFAPLLLRRLAFDAAERERAIERLLKETIRVIDGQDQELLLKEVARPSIDQYVRMVEGKTSGLFALPMTGAAELCGASAQTLTGLDEAARHLGVLFQIQDDLLDLYGDKGRALVGSDIAEGKRSALVAYGLSTLDPQQAEWLREVLDRDRDATTSEDIAAVAKLLVKCGARDRALDELKRRHAAAVAAMTAAAAVATELHAEPLVALIRGLSELFLRPIDGLLTPSST